MTGVNTITNFIRYVKDILKSTPKSLEQVTIEPNGEWSQNTIASPSTAGPTNNNTMIQADEIDDDDLLELQSSVVKNAINSCSKTSTPSAPNRLTGSDSISRSASRSTSNKRPVGSVIDLTLSDDDEDEDPRPAKRQATMDKQNTPSGGEMGTTTSTMITGNGSGATNGNVNGSSVSSAAVHFTLPHSVSTPRTDGVSGQQSHTTLD